jgi:hypothetical protein
VLAVRVERLDDFPLGPGREDDLADRVVEVLDSEEVSK